MLRIIITADSFTGEVYLTYSDQDTLLCIDFRTASLTPEQREYIKNHTPILYTDLIASFYKTDKLRFVSEHIEISFEDFWSAYRQKINRLRAEKIWNKLGKHDKLSAYEGIKSYDRYLRRESWRSKADPDTYLKNKYWNNEWK